ncbi:NAD(P)/FAD-dependent oxidoreductase [Rhodopseudomonas palustris]|uniref:NAD(P)/FAD-dependent oxidoreductase n=1 Tax=Rhodopseudomonas palustris TaxID=1076 RepID=UPI0006421724|nr:NAD(P)/FAD-dependent oxidoreductase [Rhodopseudomonas palustris]
MASDVRRPSVVVIGAGFGGLEAVRALAHAEVNITLIDRRNHHCFQPLLYQVATAALSPADVAWPIRSLLSDQDNVTVLMAEVEGVDVESKRVLTRNGPMVPFDYLVVAAGVNSSYFGHPEWAAVAPGLKTIEDATRIRAQILTCFEQAECADNDTARRSAMTFVVVGGGPTGVELAGSIADIAHHVLARDFRRINPRAAGIVLIEAGERVLPTFDAQLSEYAATSLRRMGVEVLTGVSVADCARDAVTLSDGRRIETGCMLWAAGVRATPAAEWLAADADRSGRLTVDEFLRVPSHRNVFAIGDIAAAQSDGQPVPGLAPAAKQMGRFVGALIAAETAGRAVEKPFVYRHQGDLATIGRKSAVVSVRGLKLKGFPGWMFWGLVHVYFMMGGRNRIAVLANWMWEYMTYQRGARLIS